MPKEKKIYIPISSVIALIRAIHRTRKIYKRYKKQQLLGGNMAKFEFGITVSELMAMLPGLMSDIWGHYSDDKRISTDEALEIVSGLLQSMAGAADSEEVSDLFLALADAVSAVGPFVTE